MSRIIGRSGQRSHCRLPIDDCRSRTLDHRGFRHELVNHGEHQLAIGNRKLAMKITSRDNSLLRRARAVRDGKITESIFVEGLRLCEEALSSGVKIESVIYSEEILRKERAAQLIAELESLCETVASVSEKLLDSIS